MIDLRSAATAFAAVLTPRHYDDARGWEALPTQARSVALALGLAEGAGCELAWPPPPESRKYATLVECTQKSFFFYCADAELQALWLDKLQATALAARGSMQPGAR